MFAVLLLEDDDDLRETLAMAVEESAGVVVLKAKSVEEVVALGERAIQSACAVLDMNLGAGQPTGIDALLWLRERGFTGRAIFLTGHAGAYPQLRETSRQANTVVLEKPTPLPQLMSMVQESCA